jgi:hypothetical protein
MPCEVQTQAFTRIKKPADSVFPKGEVLALDGDSSSKYHERLVQVTRRRFRERAPRTLSY